MSILTQQRNIPLVLCFLLILAPGAAYPVSSLQASPTMSEPLQEELKQAQAHVSQGDYSTAKIHLKSFLQQQPQNAAARALLGQVYLAQRNPVAALKELQKAHQLHQSAPRDYLTDLAKAYLQAGQSQKVMALATSTNDFSSPKKQAEFTASQGYALLASGRLSEAQTSLENALNIARSPYSLVALAKLRLLQQSLDRALALLQEALLQAPDNFEAHTTMGQLRSQQRDSAAAVEQFTQALKLAPGQHSVLIMRAREYIKQQDYPSARQDVLAILRADEHHLTANRLAARLHMGQQQYQQAIDKANKVLLLTPEDIPMQFILGAAHYSLKNFEQARQHLQAFIRQPPDNLAATRMLAEIYLRLQQPQAVIELVKAIVTPTIAQDRQVVQAKARALFMSGQVAAGIAELTELLAREPNNLAARALLSVGYLIKGHPEHAASVLVTPDPEIQFPLAEQITRIYLTLQSKKTDQALQLIVQASSLYPDNPALIHLQGQALDELGNIDGALQLWKQALTQQPDYIPALASLANQALRQSRFEHAEQLFQRILLSDPTHLNSLLALVDINRRQKDEKSMLQWLIEARQSNPQAAAPVTLLVDYLIKIDHRDAASRLAKNFYHSNPKKLMALSLMAKIASMENNLNAAQSFLKQITSANRLDIEHRLLLAKIQTAEGKLQPAQQTIKEITDIQPQHVEALLLSAQISLNLNELEQAERSIDQLKQHFSDSTQVQELQARLAASQGDLAEAGLLFEKILEVQPQNRKVKLNLAKVYLNTGNPNALTISTELYQSAPENTLIMDNHGWIMLHQGDTQEAIKLIRAAALKDPNNSEIQFHLAAALNKHGETQAAEQQLKDLLGGSIPRQQKEMAEQLLRNVQSNKTTETSDSL